MEQLVVFSKVKKRIKTLHNMNTAGLVADHLTKLIERVIDNAAVYADGDGRKTVMDRDIERAVKELEKEVSYVTPI